MPFAPSLQQAAVLDWVNNGTGSAFVEAVAGAGKTTTLVEALSRTNGSVAFTAYNKKIAQEIEQRVGNLNLGNRVRVGTFHSFGLGAWRRVYPRVQIDEKAKREQVERTLVIPKPLLALVPKLIGLAKQRGLGLFGAVEDRSQWFDIVDHFDLAHDLEEADGVTIDVAVDLAIAGLKLHRELGDHLIDFDDMIYLPVVTGCKMWENDWVFVDEAQDTNPARRALARKMLRKGGRAVFVGDRHQAIYGFTGADADAIDQITHNFNCMTLPLTVTFRCPKAVVEAAHEVVQHIEAHETAPEGTVRDAAFADMVKSDLSPADAILCRNTKPLVETAYNLIRRGIACHVEGKDIGVGLLKLVNRWSVRTIDDLDHRLEAYAERETAKLVAKGRETQAEALQDRVDTVRTLMDGCPDVDCLRQKIATMFLDGDKEAKPTLTLSTVHKAKGREWNRVFILGRGAYMPSKWARQPWQLEQENNLIYVAYTRAKSELVFVEPELKP